MLSIGLSPSPQQLAAMIARVDVDQTGTVEFDEFLRMIVAQSGGLGNIRDDSDLREAFRLMDADGDQKIGVKDLVGVLGELGESVSGEEVREWIKVVGGGEDVSYQDFVKMMNSGS